MEQKHISWLIMLGVIGVLILGTFVLLAVGVLHPTMATLRPHEAAPTPTPRPVELIVAVIATPAPASPTPVPTQAAYPSNAVNLLVNGVPVMALSNREMSERLLSEYLSVCANENLGATEHLIRAYIDAELTTMPVDGTAEYLTYDEALTRLLNNRTIIPVVRSVEKATLPVGTVEAAESAHPYLPVGTRLIRSLGKAEHLFGLSETLYKSGMAVSASTTLAETRVGSDPAPRLIENGTYLYEPSTETPDAVGPTGKDPGELRFTAPCSGAVSSYFGLRDGVMHYGVDYACMPGEALRAPESGTVIFIGQRGDYGLVVEIRHGNGFVSRLAHCASVSVELEQHVYRGDPIAVLAKEESQAEPHLHYELLIDGIPFNPLQYVK